MSPEDKIECERSIVLAADHVGRLRECDVMRVCEDYFFTYGTCALLVQYISENRPDLRNMAESCEAEIESGARFTRSDG